MAPPATPKLNKKKKSALLRYALRVSPPAKKGRSPYAGRTPSGADRQSGKGSAAGAKAANKARGPKGVPTSKLAPGVDLKRGPYSAVNAAPGSSLAGFADLLVPKGLRLGSRYHMGQQEQSLLNPAFNPGFPKPDTGGGSWWQNLGKDALSIVTGVPGMLSLAGRTLATPYTATYGHTLGRLLPGGSAARSFSADVGRDLWTAADAAGDDLRYRWGPLFQGDLDKFGGRIQEHPGFFALDVASLVSGGSGAVVKGASMGAKVGRALTGARHARIQKGPNWFPANTPPPGPKSTVMSRVSGIPRQSATATRMPGPGPIERILTSPGLARVGDARKMDRRIRTRDITTMGGVVPTKAGGLERLELPSGSVRLRNYSASPVMRSYQKGFDKILGGIEKLSNTTNTVRGTPRYMSTTRRDQRAIRRDQQRNIRYAEGARDSAVHLATRDFARAVLYKRGITKDKNAEVLVTLRADNIAVPKEGKKASERVSEHLTVLRQELDQQVQRGMPTEALQGLRANIELVEGLLKNPGKIDNPTPTILRATEETRKVRQTSQSYRERLAGKYGITSTTRGRAGAYREAVGTGQARFFEDLGGLMNPERYEELVASGRTYLSNKEVTRAARDLYRGGTGLGSRGSSAQALARVEAYIKEGSLPEPGTPEADNLLAAGNLHTAVSQAQKRAGSGKVPLTAEGRIHTKAKEEQYRSDAALRRLLDDPENLFRPGERPSGDAGHRASMPVGYGAGHRNAKSTFGFGELGRADRQATGTAYRGHDSYSRESTMLSVQRSINSFYTVKSVQDLLDKFAMRRVGSDKPYVFRAEDAAMALDDDKWTLVSTRVLEELVKEIDTLDPAKAIDSIKQFGNPAEARRLLAEGDQTVVAIPTVVAREIRQAVNDPHGLVRKYDSVMNMWRAGILAYTPRWFVNNMLGTGFFLGVMSGLDIKAFRQASRDGRAVREALIPHEAESVSHSYAIGRADEGRGGLDPQSRSRFMRGAHRMFMLNQRLEGRLRRAAYISRAKSNLRREGLLRGRNPAKPLTDDELFDAIIKMPEDLKQQTLRDMEFFVGQYKSYGWVEKNILRRIIPFYSWLRVINTFAFGLPFKSPLRAEAVRIGTTMAEVLGEDMEGLPLWEKGRFTFGPFALRTNNINPLYSVAEEIAAVTGASSPQEALTDLSRVAGGSMAPPFQAAIGQISGRNPFGTRDFTAPMGVSGSTSQFGFERKRFNYATGEYENYYPTPNFITQMAESVLPFSGPIRQGLSGDRQPYDTVSTLELLGGQLGIGDKESMYQPRPKTPRGRGRLPYGLGAVTGVLGAPLYTVDKEQEQKAIAKSQLDFLKAQRDTAKAKAREALRRAADAGVVIR